MNDQADITSGLAAEEKSKEGGMPRALLLVHGYSVRSFETYGLLPSLLQADKFASENIWLSAYDSLNDDITCDDLARALEIRVAALEAAGLKLNQTGVIAHSTGAIVVRRWLLNRWKAGAAVPSHFVSLAGANHGSTLAQLGQTQLAYFFRSLAEGTSVGLEVLQDLDYGSEFLLKLNEDWLDAYLSAHPPATLAFSLVGDEHSALVDQLAWQTHENGSDSTVRVSGSNLNYRFITYDQTAPQPVLTVKELSYVVPHLVMHSISHTGDHGIIGGNAASMELVYPRITEALGISTAEGYKALSETWDSLTSKWNAAYPDQCDSTIVFSLKHPGGRNVKDSLILIKDQSGGGAGMGEAQAVFNVKSSIETRQPIQNNFTPSSVSFYVNYPEFVKTYPHTVQIQVNSGCAEITYTPTIYTVDETQKGSIRPNEFAYVKVTLARQALGTYVVIPQCKEPDVKKTWPPMPG